jgi:predicted TIM-barrel fold metal-dependent hydrolase
MDKIGIDKIVIFSPYPGILSIEAKPITPSAFREAIKFLSKIQKEAEDRILGFAFIDPRMNNVINELEWALTTMELKGVKMIPAGWYPYEETLYPIYEKIESLHVPVIFHSGISWGFPDSSRFCRPTFYEALMKFPKIRFALAHIGWPWVDECLAVVGRFKAAVGWNNIDKLQAFVDITAGTPRIWRTEALRKAIVYLGAEVLMFGSDNLNPDKPESFTQAIKRDIEIMKEELGLSKDIIYKIMRENLEEFLKGIR